MKSTFFSVFKFAAACSFLFVVYFTIGTKVLSAEPTLLHLDFQDSAGQSSSHPSHLGIGIGGLCG